MNKKQLVVRLAMIVSTLGETTEAGESVAASMIYLALGSDYQAYWDVVQAGERVGWLKITPERIEITPAGRVKAREFQALGV